MVLLLHYIYNQILPIYPNLHSNMVLLLPNSVNFCIIGVITFTFQYGVTIT